MLIHNATMNIFMHTGFSVLRNIPLGRDLKVDLLGHVSTSVLPDVHRQLLFKKIMLIYMITNNMESASHWGIPSGERGLDCG